MCLETFLSWKFLLLHFQPALILCPSRLHKAMTPVERTEPAALTIYFLPGPQSQAAEPCRVDWMTHLRSKPALHTALPHSCPEPQSGPEQQINKPWRPDHIPHWLSTSKPNGKHQIPSFGICLAWSHNCMPYPRSESERGCSPQVEAQLRRAPEAGIVLLTLMGSGLWVMTKEKLVCPVGNVPLLLRGQHTLDFLQSHLVREKQWQATSSPWILDIVFLLFCLQRGLKDQLDLRFLAWK